MTMKSTIDLTNSTWYHTTRRENLAVIQAEGFKTWRYYKDECLEGWYAGGGNLGRGIYITANWKSALLFHEVLLTVKIREGTRILDASVPEDPKVIRHLRREFGREVLTKPPWQVLPNNKKLTQSELINLFRYQYRKSWSRIIYRPHNDSPQKWQDHANLQSKLRRMLIRYGFDGYGNPHDDNGIVIFADDRLTLDEVIADMPGLTSWNIARNEPGTPQSLDEIRRLYPPSSDEEYQQAAKRHQEWLESFPKYNVSQAEDDDVEEAEDD